MSFSVGAFCLGVGLFSIFICFISSNHGSHRMGDSRLLDDASQGGIGSLSVLQFGVIGSLGLCLNDLTKVVIISDTTKRIVALRIRMSQDGTW